MRPVFRILLALLAFAFSPVSALAQLDAPKITVTTPAFSDGAPIPIEFTCSGTDKSPALSWKGLPESAKSVTLIVDDPDAPGGTFLHWVIFNLPPRTDRLPEDVPKQSVVPGGGQQGTNGMGKYGYAGPCPPPGKVHHYHFKVFVLDSNLKQQAGATADEVEKAMEGHVIARGELVGTFAR